MKRTTLSILVTMLACFSEASDLEAFDKAVFGDSANGITPMTHEEMKAFKSDLDRGKSPNLKNNPAYEDAKNRAFLLSPEQIREVKKIDDKVKQEKARSVRAYKGVTSSNTLDLSSGGEIQIIRLAKNYACSISFLDSTGQPWPISHFSPRQSKVFTVTNPDKHQHILEVSSTEDYAQSNMTVTFVGLDSPVVIELISGFNEEVDFRKELHLPIEGPNAIRKTSHLPTVSDNTMLAFLDNVPPMDAKLRDSIGADRQTLIWEYKGNLYIRSKAWLHIPAPLMRQKSSDGTRVYKTRKSPSLSMSLEGKPIQILLKD